MRFSLPLAVASVCVLLAACSGEPVQLGTRADQPVPTGPSRDIEAKSCGFQLLLFIPIGINDRQEKAHASLQAQANGDYITDVQVKESWFYGFAGTGYCTELHAKAISAAKS